MTIIEYKKKMFKFPSGMIYTLSVICIISQSLLVMNETMAGTTVENKTVEDSTQTVEKKESWYEGTWLDGSWIPQSVQIHGFLSQGFVHTSANNFFGESENSVSTDFREIGLNGSWTVIPELQLSMQIVYRDAGLTNEEGVLIDYGYANYSFFSNETTLLGIKAGRVPTPFGFYNDTRDVASLRPGIILPQSIYFERNRNLAISADGGYFSAEHRSDYGDFFLQTGVVQSRGNDPEFKNGVVGSLPGKFDGALSWINQLNYEWRSGLVRLGFSYADLNFKYNPDSGTESRNLQPGKFKFTPFVFSFQYNEEQWSLTSEYAIRRRRTTDFGVPDTDTTGYSFYVQGTYKFTSWMEAMVRYDHLISDWNDSTGEKWAATRPGRVPYSRFAKDWTAGLRFTVIPKLLVSLEYHYVNGTGWLSTLENPDASQTKQKWNLYMMMISYDF